MKLKLLIILLLNSAIVNAQKQDEIDRFILKQVNDQKITGLSIGVIQKGKIIKARGYGYANLEHKVPATENTVFKLASVSKQIIATAIMELVQKGKLKLTDTVTKYFKGAPATWNNITIRNLLNHTSGLERESPAFKSMEEQPDSVLIQASYGDALIFSPGSKWQYCNLGYFMLADIIRQVSGKPFPQYMKDEIFIKYGLDHTQTTTIENLVPARADGYVLAGHDSLMNAEDYIALRPSGAFISTVIDLMKWEMLIQQNKIMSKENWQLMWNDVVKTDSANPKSDYYGYGWFRTMYKNRELVYHGGALPGFRSIYYRFPSDGTAIIILTNSNHSNTPIIAQGVADILYKNNVSHEP
jgi:CubicO group peptidase (beta-lactamase class C family)